MCNVFASSLSFSYFSFHYSLFNVILGLIFLRQSGQMAKLCKSFVFMFKTMAQGLTITSVLTRFSGIGIYVTSFGKLIIFAHIETS